MTTPPGRPVTPRTLLPPARVRRPTTTPPMPATQPMPVPRPKLEVSRTFSARLPYCPRFGILKLHYMKWMLPPLRFPLPCLLAWLAFAPYWAVAQLAPADSEPGASVRWGAWEKWGDQGDGTYRNPVLPSDYSDLDCIRVGSDYYAISSTFQFSPGVVILHSRDLVNWTIQGHAVADLTQIGPELNWDRMNRYGHGIWAGAIRFHNERFWIYFGTPDEG